MRPVWVAAAAARAAAPTTPAKGTGRRQASALGKVLLTVPQAAMRNLTFLESRKAMSCRVYWQMVSLLRVP